MNASTSAAVAAASVSGAASWGDGMIPEVDRGLLHGDNRQTRGCDTITIIFEPMTAA